MRTEKIVLFRQSNVTYSEYLTIKLTGRNRLAIVGGTDDDLDVIRNCLQSRWPYPLSRDYKVLSGVSSWKDICTNNFQIKYISCYYRPVIPTGGSSR